jgi:hypothetical protein
VIRRPAGALALLILVPARGARAFDPEQTSALLLQGGIGASGFVTDTVSVDAGYRMQHVSSGNTSSPNRGFEADTGLVGVSIVCP